MTTFYISVMGWFGKSKYEKHAEKLEKKLDRILQEEMEIPALRELCKNLIGSSPRPKLKLLDKHGDEKCEFIEPISRKDYCTFYVHYQELGEVNDKMLAKYLVNHNHLSKHDEDYVYITNHNEGDDEDDDEKKDEDKKSKSNSSDYLMDSIILKLERDFEPEKVYDEKELQNLLRSFLQQAFPDTTVEKEVNLKNIRGNVDIVINGKYAIEVKIPSNRAELRNLTAQLEEYQEEYPNILALIMNNEELNLSEDIKYYVDRYKLKLGIESVVKIGKKRG